MVAFPPLDYSLDSHDDDKPHEECGVFGIWNAHDAGAMTALGLHALQHRGQEATGIVSYNVRDPARRHRLPPPTRAWAWSATCSATPASSRACPAALGGRPQPLRHHG